MVAVFGGGGWAVGDGEDAQAFPAFTDGVGEVDVQRLIAAAAHAERERADAGCGEGGENIHPLSLPLRVCTRTPSPTPLFELRGTRRSPSERRREISARSRSGE